MPDPSRWSTVRLLTTAARLVEHAWNKRLADIGVTHAGATVLAVLADRGELTQTALAGSVQVQPQTIGRAVARLVDKGHVERTRSLDRRAQVVIITPSGRNVLEQVENLEQVIIPEGILHSSDLRTHLQTIVHKLRRQDSLD
ncbi:MarR family transcriptional regulator [Arthrobacter sp. H5]|uniref:MarR family winged helix-turn-helix transcriptional regulator n=1 Tax=Arthrobacter sp. H5 TaxID=1267973 RepID=UPI0004BBBBC4|nr:MarR family transcriptional regulator [Arthrobacter sp. H5]